MEKLLKKYCAGNEELYQILLRHSRQVARRALNIAITHADWTIDTGFLEEAALLHDIGCVLVNAPTIHCLGTEPYIRHGLLGGEILRAEGLPLHARVAERHTGTGLTREAIISQSLPLPLQDFVPESLEERLICYADKFYSKTHLEEEKTYPQALHSLEKFGKDGVVLFQQWHDEFEPIVE